jgi:hypothetical protein
MSRFISYEFPGPDSKVVAIIQAHGFLAFARQGLIDIAGRLCLRGWSSAAREPYR